MDFIPTNYGMPNPTKKAEYRRSIELFQEILNTQGIYFALALFYDSGYNNKDLKAMMELCEPPASK